MLSSSVSINTKRFSFRRSNYWKRIECALVCCRAKDIHYYSCIYLDDKLPLGNVFKGEITSVVLYALHSVRPPLKIPLTLQCVSIKFSFADASKQHWFNQYLTNTIKKPTANYWFENFTHRYEETHVYKTLKITKRTRISKPWTYALHNKNCPFEAARYLALLRAVIYVYKLMYSFNTQRLAAIHQRRGTRYKSTSTVVWIIISLFFTIYSLDGTKDRSGRNQYIINWTNRTYTAHIAANRHTTC